MAADMFEKRGYIIERHGGELRIFFPNGVIGCVPLEIVTEALSQFERANAAKAKKFMPFVDGPLTIEEKLNALRKAELEGPLPVRRSQVANYEKTLPKKKYPREKIE